MLVRDVMSPDFNSVRAEESALAAARRLVRSGIGAIPVVDAENRLLSLLALGDIARVLIFEEDLDHTEAGAIEGRDLAVAAGAPLAEATEMMDRSQLQPLPVVDERGVVIGAISRWDIEARDSMAKHLGAAAGDVIKTIAPQDPGYAGQIGQYLFAGCSALDCVRKALERSGRGEVTSILDLACGYGRILRVFKAAFPAASLAACDVNRAAVDFCAQTFGAAPLYSRENPRELDFGRRFDLIWCGSLFTHIEKEPWLGFLDLAARQLADEGLFVFTTHGNHSRSIWQTMSLSKAQVDQVVDGYEREGFGYASYEWEDFEFGLTANAPDWVRAQIDERPDLRFLMHIPNGWQPPAPLQDVYACVKTA
jgi:CBS domain-containing protein